MKSLENGTPDFHPGYRYPTVSNKAEHDDQALASGSSQDVWCYCKRPEGRELIIRCDREECYIKWFQCSCL